MKKNKEFFNGKTWEEVFNIIDFDKHYNKLCKKLKNKKVLIYGLGIMFDYFADNYDLTRLNIRAVSDKKFNNMETIEFNDYNAILPEKIIELDIDAIIIATQYPVSLRNYLKREIYKNKRTPQIYFLLNKPLTLYIEEIFS